MDIDIKVGDVWESRDGTRRWTIVCVTAEGSQPVIAWRKGTDDHTFTGCFSADGRWVDPADSPSNLDLVRKIVPPPPLWEGELWLSPRGPLREASWSAREEEEDVLREGWRKIRVREIPEGTP